MSHEIARMSLMDEEKVESYSFDVIGGKDVMPILGYYGPVLFDEEWKNKGAELAFPDRFSEEFFELIAGTGINIIGKSDTNYAEHPEIVERALKLAAKNGLGMLVNDQRLNEEDGKTLSLEEVEACVKAYKDYPAYIGNYVVDEPNHREYWNPGNADKRLVEAYFPIFHKLQALGLFGYGNLFSNWMHADEEVYKKYIADFVEGTKIPYLSYDMYPFDSNSMQYVPRYFRNLTQIREKAEAAGIPFWTFVQAGAQWNDACKCFDSDGYFPSKGQFFWNVGTELAFGAKGMQYFPLIQPVWFAYAESMPYDFERNGLIGADGRKTRWYDYAKAMNAQIAAVDEVLMNSVNKGVIVTGSEAREHIGTSQYLMEETSWRELAGVEGNTFIGCFNYKGNTALYVVNYDLEKEQTITLNLADTYRVTVIENAEKESMLTDRIVLEFSAGNHALVVFDE